MEPLFPPDPDELCIHVRDYEVRAFRLSPSRMLMRGAVRDRKPAGLYIPGDPDPLVLHHMNVDLEVTFPEMMIDKVSVTFGAHPEPECPNIVPAFDQLVGTSVSRGFNKRLRELVGGPLGCTHVLALLTAMGPVVVQCIWSMRAGPLLARGLRARGGLGGLALVDRTVVDQLDHQPIDAPLEGEFPPVAVAHR